MGERGRDHFRTLDDAGVAIRTMGRLLNVHRSNLRVYGEVRGFHPRHWPRLELAADLVRSLPAGVPANEWLRTPHPGLAGRSPLDLISAYGADAPIPSGLPRKRSNLVQLERRRWWITFLALVEVPAPSATAAAEYLRTALPQHGRYAEEMLTVDLRWAWTPDEYDTTFVVAEVGALHLPGLRADRRWDPYHYNGLHNSSAWFDMGHAQPLREALLTHWHTTFTGAEISLSLNDSPVPLDEYDDYMFTHRRLVRPSSPPWETGSGQPILRYLSRLADGGPRVPDDYKPFPQARDGSLAELWTLPEPFNQTEPRVTRGVLHRHRVEFLDHHWNTGVRYADDLTESGDPRALRLIRRTAIRP